MKKARKGYRDAEVLRNLYWAEGLSIPEIAQRFDVHQKTIWRWFEKYNIDRRDYGEGNTGENLKTNTVSYRTDPKGYCTWGGTTEYDGFSTTFVHQLLAVADGADPYKVYSRGDYHCHHKNGIKWDNRPQNIEVLTPKEHAEKHPEKFEKAGRAKVYTEEDLLSWIDAFVAEFGVVPVSTDLIGWPGPAPETYRSRFGSVSEAVEAAGYKPRRKL